MKKIFHDIIPKEKRSIRNIPLIKRGSEIESVDTQSINTTFEVKKPDSIQPPVKSYTKSSNSMDGIRPKSYDNDDYIEDQYPTAKDKITTQKDIEPAFLMASANNFNDTKDKSALDEEDSSDLNFEEWNRKQKKSYFRASVVLILFVAISFFLLSTYFGGATISINPIRHDVVLQESKISLDAISHEKVSTKLDSSDEVSANGTTKVERKATGRVILYNAFNSATQKLVEGTRLETPNGLIYKLKSEVSIPGQKSINGKAVPGSIEAEVEASEPGEKYNQGLRDFNVVAYKGSDRYEKIYGRSKTALSNGFSGTVPNIAAKDISSSTSQMKDRIRAAADDFFTKKAKEKGSNFVYIPSTKKIVFEEVKNEISKDGKTAKLKLEAEATAVLFDSTTLFAEIIKNQSEQIHEQIEGGSNFDTSKEIVYTGDFARLNINLSSDTNLQVTGTTSISSSIDATKVARAVSGLSKEQAIGAIKRLVELETIEIDIRPWWNKKLPSADKIVIKTEN